MVYDKQLKLVHVHQFLAIVFVDVMPFAQSLYEAEVPQRDKKLHSRLSSAVPLSKVMS